MAGTTQSTNIPDGDQSTQVCHAAKIATSNTTQPSEQNKTIGQPTQSTMISAQPAGPVESSTASTIPSDESGFSSIEQGLATLKRKLDKLSELETENAKLKQQCLETQKAITAVKEDQNARVDAALAAVSIGIKSLRDLRSEGTTEPDLTDQNSEIKKLTASLDAAEAEKKTLIAKRGSAKSEAQKAVAELEQANNMCRDEKSKHEVTRKALTKANIGLKDLENDRLNALIELEIAINDRDMARKANGDAQKDRDTAGIERDKAREERDRAIKALDQAIDDEHRTLGKLNEMRKERDRAIARHKYAVKAREKVELELKGKPAAETSVTAPDI